MACWSACWSSLLAVCSSGWRGHSFIASVLTVKKVSGVLLQPVHCHKTQRQHLHLAPQGLNVYIQDQKKSKENHQISICFPSPGGLPGFGGHKIFLLTCFSVDPFCSWGIHIVEYLDDFQLQCPGNADNTILQKYKQLPDMDVTAIKWEKCSEDFSLCVLYEYKTSKLALIELEPRKDVSLIHKNTVWPIKLTYYIQIGNW